MSSPSSPGCLPQLLFARRILLLVPISIIISLCTTNSAAAAVLFPPPGTSALDVVPSDANLHLFQLDEDHHLCDPDDPDARDPDDSDAPEVFVGARSRPRTALRTFLRGVSGLYRWVCREDLLACGTGENTPSRGNSFAGEQQLAVFGDLSLYGWSHGTVRANGARRDQCSVGVSTSATSGPPRGAEAAGRETPKTRPACPVHLHDPAAESRPGQNLLADISNPPDHHGLVSKKVRVVGLLKKPELNGREGVVLSRKDVPDGGEPRFAVKFSDDTGSGGGALVKAANLEVLEQVHCTAPLNRTEDAPASTVHDVDQKDRDEKSPDKKSEKSGRQHEDHDHMIRSALSGPRKQQKLSPGRDYVLFHHDVSASSSHDTCCSGRRREGIEKFWRARLRNDALGLVGFHSRMDLLWDDRHGSSQDERFGLWHDSFVFADSNAADPPTSTARWVVRVYYQLSPALEGPVRTISYRVQKISYPVSSAVDGANGRWSHPPFPGSPPPALVPLDVDEYFESPPGEAALALLNALLSGLDKHRASLFQRSEKLNADVATLLELWTKGKEWFSVGSASAEGVVGDLDRRLPVTDAAKNEIIARVRDAQSRGKTACSKEPVVAHPALRPLLGSDLWERVVQRGMMNVEEDLPLGKVLLAASARELARRLQHAVRTRLIQLLDLFTVAVTELGDYSDRQTTNYNRGRARWAAELRGRLLRLDGDVVGGSSGSGFSSSDSSPDSCSEEEERREESRVRQEPVPQPRRRGILSSDDKVGAPVPAFDCDKQARHAVRLLHRIRTAFGDAKESMRVVQDVGAQGAQDDFFDKALVARAHAEELEAALAEWELLDPLLAGAEIVERIPVAQFNPKKQQKAKAMLAAMLGEEDGVIVGKRRFDEVVLAKELRRCLSELVSSQTDEETNFRLLGYLASFLQNHGPDLLFTELFVFWRDFAQAAIVFAESLTPTERVEAPKRLKIIKFLHQRIPIFRTIVSSFCFVHGGNVYKTNSATRQADGANPVWRFLHSTLTGAAAANRRPEFMWLASVLDLRSPGSAHLVSAVLLSSEFSAEEEPLSLNAIDSLTWLLLVPGVQQENTLWFLQILLRFSNAEVLFDERLLGVYEEEPGSNDEKRRVSAFEAMQARARPYARAMANSALSFKAKQVEARKLRRAVVDQWVSDARISMTDEKSRKANGNKNRTGVGKMEMRRSMHELLTVLVPHREDLKKLWHGMLTDTQKGFRVPDSSRALATFLHVFRSGDTVINFVAALTACLNYYPRLTRGGKRDESQGQLFQAKSAVTVLELMVLHATTTTTALGTGNEDPLDLLLTVIENTSTFEGVQEGLNEYTLNIPYIQTTLKNINFRSRLPFHKLASLASALAAFSHLVHGLEDWRKRAGVTPVRENAILGSENVFQDMRCVQHSLLFPPWTGNGLAAWDSADLESGKIDVESGQALTTGKLIAVGRIQDSGSQSELLHTREGAYSEYLLMGPSTMESSQRWGVEINAISASDLQLQVDSVKGIFGILEKQIQSISREIHLRSLVAEVLEVFTKAALPGDWAAATALPLDAVMSAQALRETWGVLVKMRIAASNEARDKLGTSHSRGTTPVRAVGAPRQEEPESAFVKAQFGERGMLSLLVTVMKRFSDAAVDRQIETRAWDEFVLVGKFLRALDGDLLGGVAGTPSGNGDPGRSSVNPVVAEGRGGQGEQGNPPAMLGLGRLVLHFALLPGADLRTDTPEQALQKLSLFQWAVTSVRNEMAEDLRRRLRSLESELRESRKNREQEVGRSIQRFQIHWNAWEGRLKMLEKGLLGGPVGAEVPDLTSDGGRVVGVLRFGPEVLDERGVLPERLQQQVGRILGGIGEVLGRLGGAPDEFRGVLEGGSSGGFLGGSGAGRGAAGRKAKAMGGRKVPKP